MKTNITIDNYEAYLLDYLEGNLGPDEAEQLKAFVAAQGLDWDELTEELPHLEAPQIVYEDKKRMKKKDALDPLYVKIASAAAAAGLLLTIALWPEKTPEPKPVVEVKPVVKVDTLLPPRLIVSEEEPMPPQQMANVDTPKTKAKKSQVPTMRTETTLLADLSALKAVETPTSLTMTLTDEENLEQIARITPNLAFIASDENDNQEEIEDERNLSLIGRGIYRLTNGNHDSFASLFSTGLNTAKQEIRLAATDVALTAYNRADERIEETKERWQERREE